MSMNISVSYTKNKKNNLTDLCINIKPSDAERLGIIDFENPKNYANIELLNNNKAKITFVNENNISNDIKNFKKIQGKRRSNDNKVYLYYIKFGHQIKEILPNQPVESMTKPIDLITKNNNEVSLIVDVAPEKTLIQQKQPQIKQDNSIVTLSSDTKKRKLAGLNPNAMYGKPLPEVNKPNITVDDIKKLVQKALFEQSKENLKGLKNV